MFKSILLPIDVEHESSWRRTLPVAKRLAEECGAELNIVGVVPPFGTALVGGFFPEDYEEKLLGTVKEHLAGVVQEAGIGADDCKMHVTRGVIYEEILRVASVLGCDVIVMAAARPELKDYLLGPNAARVVRHAKQSVFVVRE